MGSAHANDVTDRNDPVGSIFESEHAPGFVNHALHIGLPRAPGGDTWGHASLWRNPASRQDCANLPEWEALHNVAPPPILHSFSTPSPSVPQAHSARASVFHQQPVHLSNQQDGSAIYSSLESHPRTQGQYVALPQYQDAFSVFALQQRCPPPHAMSFQNHHAERRPEMYQRNSRPKSGPRDAPHGQQFSGRRVRNNRGGTSPRNQSTASCPPSRMHNGFGGISGNECGKADKSMSAVGSGSTSTNVPSVREFNRRISACARRRDLNGASRVLDELDRTPGVQRNLFTYNAVINALVMCAQHDKALEFWTEMQDSGIEPNLVTYNTMMKSCFGGTDDDVKRAFALVKEMEERGIAADRVTLNSLINACVTAGMLREGQRVYEQMRARDIEPDDFTFTTLAKAGASQNNVAMLDALLVHQLHHHSTARNRAASAGGSSESDERRIVSKSSVAHRTSPVAYNTIADAYIRCGHPERALRLLSRLKDMQMLQGICLGDSSCDDLKSETIPVHPDVQSFNVVLKALREAGAPAADAFQLLHQLKMLGLEADHITLLTLADLCCRREEMALAEGVLHAATESDVREFEKGSSEWRSLCSRNAMNDAQRQAGAEFSTHHSNSVNVPGTSSGRRNVNQPKNAKANAALFNALIRGYSSLDPPNIDAAVALYREMQRYLEVYGFTWYAADFVTYTMLVDGFARIGDADRAESIISEMENAGRANVVAYNAYMKANRASGFKAAVLVLERMKRVGLRPDVVTYNTIIDLLCSEENGAALAEELVRVDMPRNGVRPDLLTFNTLIKGAARVRGSRSDAGASLGAAYRWLRELQARGLSPDEFTYQSMVSACAAAGDAPRALEFFRKVETERAKRSSRSSEGSTHPSRSSERDGSWILSSSPAGQNLNSDNDGRRGSSSRFDRGDDDIRTDSACESRSSKEWMLLPHPAAYIALMRAFLTSNGKHGVDRVLLLRDEMLARGLELGRQGYTAVADAYAERGEFEKVEETLAELTQKECVEKNGSDHSSSRAEQGLGPVHHCIRMKALCNSDRLDEAIAILPDVQDADAAVFNVLISACARTKDIQRLTVVLRAMEKSDVNPDSITSRAISGMMRSVAKTLRSYDEHFRNTLKKIAMQCGNERDISVLSASSSDIPLSQANLHGVPPHVNPAVCEQELSGPSATTSETNRDDVPFDSLLANLSLDVEHTPTTDVSSCEKFTERFD